VSSVTKQSYLQKVLKNISIQHNGFRHFAERYLQHLSGSDLERLTSAEVKALLDDGWKFLHSWTHDPPKVSIRNVSSPKNHTDRGTIIQLLLRNLPFVADSISTEIRRRGYDINFVLRGTFNITRDKGILQDLHTNNGPQNEMLMHIELRQQVDLQTLDSLENDILGIIRDIQLAVDDFEPMKVKLETAQIQLAQNNQSNEAAFLEWITQDRFIFLGVVKINNGVIDTSLGILKQPDMYTDILNELTHIAQQRSEHIWLHKPSFATKIDRYEPLDILWVNSKKGEDLVFVGMLTYAAKSIPFDQIPYISHKLGLVVEHFNAYGEYFDPQEVITTINHLPFTEVMNLTTNEIANTCKQVLTHQSKYVVLVQHRFDAVLKQIAIMMFVHQGKLNTVSRNAIKRLVSDMIGAPILHYEEDYIDNDLICLYATLACEKDVTDDIKTLPEKIAAVTLSWEDHLRSQLIHTCGVVEGETLSRKYFNIFDSAYTVTFPPEIAVKDIINVEKLLQSNSNVAAEIYDTFYIDDTQQLHLKIFKKTTKIPLFELFNALDSLGLQLISESSFQITPSALETTYWVHDLIVKTSTTIKLEHVETPFKELCQKLLSGDIAYDSLNSLALLEGLHYRQIILIKSFLSYLKQIQFSFGGKYNRDILLRNPSLANLIVQIFETRFSPDISTKTRAVLIASLTESFEQKLKSLSTEDEDKLFRQLYNLITNIIRTNYFVTNQASQLKSYISFKIDSKNIIDLPIPSPLVEIFVYSKEFEAVHLRSGKVSRGGIRWSDRGEDFRTEVLGLVKAQNTKNSVIIPMGSKGGFYVKKALPDREEAIECYQNMARAMLDITDNIINGTVVTPSKVVCYDDHDPYLVVAADKGTASFSDIANGISAEYDFWLKDAFASGGSAGYDHKKMAITSRGAWESVKQHFKEALNIDPETNIITVVGVGDMSGDVFGNGMLRSKTIQLKAAFNHQHIFIDPTPDVNISFVERERLFTLPRSSWADYSSLSDGGMIIERSSKTVTLTPQAKDMLGLTQEVVRPVDIIRSILKLNVDLMWLGGIGTYIKASSESHESVADRVNDTIRVDGQELRAKILAEGANLGCTQKGRIEYALTRNGRVNTDFIDNSGGVDCSDHEVNIKILLNQIVDNNQLSIEDRNSLLKQMTDAIAIAVTSENVLQNLALSYAAHYSTLLFDEYSALIRYLSLHAGLNPKIEFLPTITELNERQQIQQGLTRPELAVLLAYTKNHLTSEILKIDTLEEPCFNTHLEHYFPEDLKGYLLQIYQHPLRREIIATKVSSQIVDRLGIHFMHRLLHQTGKPIADILRVYHVIKEFFNLDATWSYFDSILPKLTYEDRIDFMHSISEIVYNGCAWLLMFNASKLEINTSSSVLNGLLQTVQSANLLLSTSLECILPSDKHTNLKAHIYELQQRLTVIYLSTCDNMLDARTIESFELTFNRVRSIFHFDHLHQILQNIPKTNFWGQLFILNTQLELEWLHVHLTKSVYLSILSQKNTLNEIIQKYETNIEWLSRMAQQTMMDGVYDPAAITVIMRHLENLTTLITQNLELTK